MKEAIKKPVLVLAVDPGLSGAAALVGYGDMMVRRDFKSHRDIVKAITELIKHNNPQHFVVELVGARPGQGVCSMFSFGQSTGVALASIYAAAPDRNVERPHPAAWKGFYRKRLGIPKGTEVDSRQIVLDHFPEFAFYFKRKKDHGSADAVLMGIWKLLHL